MFPLWSGVLPPRASRSKTLKRAQGKTIKRLLPKFLAVALLLTTMSVGKTVWAQEYSPHTKAGLIANPEAGKTLELKDGRTLTYRQLVESSEIEREKMLELVTKRSARSSFHEWVVATINAQTEEIKLSTATIKAETEEIKRSTATIVAETVPKLEQLVVNLRTAIGAGMKLQSYIYEYIKSIISNQKMYLDAGLKKESMEYFEFLLKRPELFKK